MDVLKLETIKILSWLIPLLYATKYFASNFVEMWNKWFSNDNQPRVFGYIFMYLGLIFFNTYELKKTTALLTLEDEFQKIIILILNIYCV